MQSKKKLWGEIHSRLDLIEDRCLQGWTYSMVVEDLAKEGIVLTEDYFGRCLRRARKARDSVAE
jgi:hypothetical protein